MTHNITGRWCMTSSENIEEYMKAMGCPTDIMAKMLPTLTATGENGHIEEYMIDMNHKAVRRCTYHKDSLVREFMVPLDVEMPGWSLNGKIMMMKMHVDGMNKLKRNERGDNYVVTACAEVNGDTCTTTWTCNNVTCTLKFRRCN
jgi:hypothetical protein